MTRELITGNRVNIGLEQTTISGYIYSTYVLGISGSLLAKRVLQTKDFIPVDFVCDQLIFSLEYHVGQVRDLSAQLKTHDLWYGKQSQEEAYGFNSAIVSVASGSNWSCLSR